MNGRPAILPSSMVFRPVARFPKAGAPPAILLQKPSNKDRLQEAPSGYDASGEEDSSAGQQSSASSNNLEALLAGLAAAPSKQARITLMGAPSFSESPSW